MIYLLDTSTLINLLRKKKNVYDFIASHESDTFVTSTLCAFELFSGVYRLPKKEQNKHKSEVNSLISSLYEVIPFTREQADIAGNIHAELNTKGERLEDLDVLIAGAALSSRATLITSNTKHFSRISSLPLLAL